MFTFSIVDKEPDGSNEHFFTFSTSFSFHVTFQCFHSTAGEEDPVTFSDKKDEFERDVTRSACRSL